MTAKILECTNSTGIVRTTVTDDMIEVRFMSDLGHPHQVKTILLTLVYITDLDEGELFRFDYNLNEVHQIIGWRKWDDGGWVPVDDDTPDEEQYLVTTPAFVYWTHEKEWKSAAFHPDKCNPYAVVLRETEGLLPLRKEK